MRNPTTSLLFHAVLFGCIAARCISTAPAAEPAKPAEKITYTDHVRPIFREHCFNCHNQNKATNDLALDSYERIRKGGASGEAVVPGDPDNSYIWNLVSHQSEPHMPPMQDKLPAGKLDLIKRWIAGGALKESGSKADVPKKAALSLAVSAGSARPAGPPILPEGLSHQPMVYTSRPGRCDGPCCRSLGSVVCHRGAETNQPLPERDAGVLGVLPFPEGIPYALRFSRSGSLLLAGGGQNVRRGLAVAYDVKTGKRLFEVGDELDVVLAADISPDLKKVALGGPEKVVKVFNTADGSQLYEIRKHTDWIYCVEFSPDGVLLATGDRAGGLAVWEAATGREYQNLEGHKGGITSVSFRWDSNVLASGSDDGTIKLWNMEDGKQLKNIGAHGNGVTAVQFIPDGRIASCGRDRMVKVWNAQGNQMHAMGPMNELALKVAMPDGGRVAAGDWSGDVRVWNAADGKQVGTLASDPPTPAGAKDAR